ncbi:uncharacterized protein LOC123718432 isoform X1 [Pieris brassicae]|uniref:uncharacterized protein LOC123718432 isoform X1 n=1 Tax=Pieris brassicae TaxID=7116 RepID=UPI001E660F26|nr:uncharacterized protein LOC123718432 isoform X1 [Pieris brassicae]
MTMGKKKNGKGGSRFFRWIKSDLPDEEDKKSPVLLLGVNKISDSPFARRRHDPQTGSIRFFRPPKSKYTRGLNGDERLEKIRKDLLLHKHKPDIYIPNIRQTKDNCHRLTCIGSCICDASDRGSFSFHRPSSEFNEIEFKYTEHIPENQPSSSKTSYNITPKSTERRHFLLSNLNERFRKTLSLDSRKIDRLDRPKSIATSNIDKEGLVHPKKKRKSFFSLDTFFDKKSDTSSIDDFCSSKYKRFELETDDSPILKTDRKNTRCKLEKLEDHFYKSLKQNVVDAVPADAYEDDVEYIEPISNFTSQSTLIFDRNDKLDAKLDIKAYEIVVQETDLSPTHLVVKVMDKSVDSIGSCSLDVDASTDFSDTTSGSLNILTPSSTTSRIKEFTSRIQERAGTLQPNLTPTPFTPPRTPERPDLLKPPKIVIDTSSHRSRSHLKKRDEHKKPSYLNLACSVNGYTNLTTYDSKIRQDINKSREASPIRPITHYRTDPLLVPIPVSANKLVVPTFPHDTNLTSKAPSKAHTDPYLANTFMAAENRQLKNDFLGTMTTKSYISSESKSFSSIQKDEVDQVFKCSYSETNFISGKEFSEYTITSNEKRVEITKENGEKLTSPMKSFIQQRVERLYGPGALAQGFFQRHKSDDILTEKSLNCQSPERVKSTEETSPKDLPVLRHLRPEFRAQLPILSPRKSKIDSPKSETSEVNIEVIENGKTVNEVNGAKSEVKNGETVKDAYYFLDLEKKETERLLALSAGAEKELESLQNQENISEEVLGLLRAASGKARLLATQKMQQFQGLCYNNINECGDEQFPTTLEDLQGFWDMVLLQVRNVDALYSHLDSLKANNWQEIAPPPSKPPATPARSKVARTPQVKNEKARLAAEKREADRKAMLEHRRRVARERQLAARASTPGQSNETDHCMSVEGSQEVEIFVGKSAPKVIPQGDCPSTTQSDDSLRS